MSRVRRPIKTAGFAPHSDAPAQADLIAHPAGQTALIPPQIEAQSVVELPHCNQNNSLYIKYLNFEFPPAEIGVDD